MGRSILAVALGFALGIVLIAVMQLLGHFIYPPPKIWISRIPRH